MTSYTNYCPPAIPKRPRVVGEMFPILANGNPTGTPLWLELFMTGASTFEILAALHIVRGLQQMFGPP